MIAMIAAVSRKALFFLVLLAGLAVNLVGGSLWAASPGSPWGANYFPNVELVTQDGTKVHFYDDLIKDKVFAINFIYTRCKDSCPLETAKLRKVQEALGEHMGRDVFFYTVSIDAKHDKPAELKKYAEKFNIGPGWTFLAGTPADVRLIREKLGMYRSDGKAEKALNEHNINILLGNEKAGQWIKRSPFDDTDALVRILTMRMQTKPVVTVANASVSPNPVMQSSGEKLFRSHCEACHSLENNDGIGPGLKGRIAKRDKAWLKRWIKEPDLMLSEKDPLALALFNQFGQVLMPNLRLNDTEVAEIVSFLESREK